MSNTPETDAALIPVNGDYVVWHGLARRLERDRDKAREDATNYFAKIGELQDELKEARKEVEYYKARYDVLKESW
jgi:uncharacterized coiled-coil DUF342 family protein